MALPRFLEEKYAAELRQMGDLEFVQHVFFAGADYGMRVFDISSKELTNGKTPRAPHVILCFARARWAYFTLRRHKIHEGDSLERIAYKLYVGLREASFGVPVPDFREVTVPRFFLKQLEKLNVQREARDRQHLSLLAKIQIVRNKVYVSRTFPSALRLIIFERDGYRCQKCLRDQRVLSELGRHLEVDHIKAYIDGGKTTYSNGVTLCNECNVGKHHMKGYQQAVYTIANT